LSLDFILTTITLRYTQAIIISIILLFFIPVLTFSQKPEGIPFIKNYSPKEYGTSTDNWAIAQDSRGIMYFGNASGVLEYDGIKWNLIHVSNNSLVRSIAIDSNGIIYVGAIGELGFLSPDKNGVMFYTSLMNKIPENERDFSDVWKTYVTPDGIYFQTFTKLIRISGNKIKIWKPKTSFHFSFFVNNEIYINERETGLKHLVNDELVLINNGNKFIGLRIYSMLPYPEGKILIATREKGLILINKSAPGNDSIFFWNVNVNKNLINDLVYAGERLSNNRFAFATLQNGILIIDNNGNIIQELNKRSGLADDNINFLLADKQRDLWIASGNGISCVETSSPLRLLHDSQGLNGSVEDIIKHKDKLYVASSLGIFVANNNSFIPVQGIASQTWSLHKFITSNDTLLLASSEEGVFKIEGAIATLLWEGIGYSLQQSKINTARLYIGMGDGLTSIRLENNRWINENYFNGINDEIRSIAEDDKGNLWLGTPFDGLLKVNFITEKRNDSLITSWNEHYKINRYDTTSGLPDMKYNIPYVFKNKMIFATVKGIYEFENKTNRFNPSQFLDKNLQQSQIYRFVPQNDSRLWMFTVSADGGKETGYAYLQKDNTYSWYSKPFGKIRESEIHSIFPDENDITWLGGPDGLLRYDGNVKKDFSQQYYCLIRKVITGKDSLIFGGNFYTVKDSMHYPVMSQPEHLKPSITYQNNSLRFEYTASTFGDEKNTEFNIYLEGFDEGWSGWSNKTLKEYTSLKEGTYTFHVKAKNIYGTESIESTYTFTILPPWYRTVWAYIAYVILFICFIYLMVQLSVRRLKKAKTQLERTVKERTAEVVKQKEEIEIQKQIVEHKNKDITDSINYAQRIQRSLLASDKLLKEHLQDYFIFFQPKDIVSGDFYWASELADGNFAFVTADSTGHGVPGAIMSMLNISCLNEAVNGNKLTEPDEILNYTRRRIIDHLSNDGSAEGGKDGMDCSLVIFNKKTKELRFAAANNPVWIVRNKEIIEFSPDKMPVGKHDNDSVSFRRQTFQLMKDDVVYTLTDGMPDQFGGPKGKKFMYKQFKELLISISTLNMHEQQEILRNTINTWKGNLEQIDDICVAGIRIL
jgi:serine phosphatase RsbU (regulator of sigma subunit)/ligand-binding sensor domain-containing protein